MQLVQMSIILLSQQVDLQKRPGLRHNVNVWMKLQVAALQMFKEMIQRLPVL